MKNILEKHFERFRSPYLLILIGENPLIRMLKSGVSSSQYELALIIGGIGWSKSFATLCFGNFIIISLFFTSRICLVPLKIIVWFLLNFSQIIYYRGIFEMIVNKSNLWVYFSNSGIDIFFTLTKFFFWFFLDNFWKFLMLFYKIS